MFIKVNAFKEKLGTILEKYSEIKELAKDKIIELATEKLEGYEKKEQVDAFITRELEILKANYSNPILVFIIDYLIGKIPATTQKIYDKLKAKVKGITTK